MDIPLICTEHYPEKLGNIVSDIDISHAKAVVSKTRFSMIVPELENKIKEIFGDKPQDVVLYGLEVKHLEKQIKFEIIYLLMSTFI